MSKRAIGERITLARINKAMERSTLSKLAGIDYMRLYNIEKGIDRPTEAERHAIFETIGKASARDVWRTYPKHYRGASS